MKRQLERLKGKRLVTGDANLMTKNEICINATPNGVEVKEIGTDGSIKDIASGGSGVKEWYYSIDMPGLTDLMGEGTMFLFAYGFVPNYVITLDNNNKYVEYYIGNVDVIVDLRNSIETMIAFRVIDNIPINIEAESNMYFCYGNIFDKLKSAMTILVPSGSGEYDNFVAMISPYIKEISKQEYESLIEQPAIILGK